MSRTASERDPLGGPALECVTIPPERLILALPDTELEKFACDWVSLKKKEYVEVERFTGPGDRGTFHGHARLRAGRK